MSSYLWLLVEKEECPCIEFVAGLGQNEMGRTPRIGSSRLSFRSSPLRELKDTTTTSEKVSGKKLSRSCVEAKRTKDSLVEQKLFWENRLLLLKREAERAKVASHLRRLTTSSATKSVIGSETVERQLEEERQHAERARQEKLQAIEQHKALHKKALRQALQQRIYEKLTASRESKQCAEERRSLVLRLREEVSETKRQKRDKVLAERAKARDRAERIRALRTEEATRNYEARIRHIQEEGEEVGVVIKGYMQESQKLLDKLKRLEGMQHATNLSASDIENV